MDHVLGIFFFRWGGKVAVMFVEHSVIRLTQRISVINFWLRFHLRIILNWVIRNKSSCMLHIYLSSTSNKCYIFLDNEQTVNKANLDIVCKKYFFKHQDFVFLSSPSLCEFYSNVYYDNEKN